MKLTYRITKNDDGWLLTKRANSRIINEWFSEKPHELPIEGLLLCERDESHLNALLSIAKNIPSYKQICIDLEAQEVVTPNQYEDLLHAVKKYACKTFYNFRLLVKKEVLMDSTTFDKGAFDGYFTPKDAVHMAITRIADCNFPKETEILLIPTFK